MRVCVQVCVWCMLHKCFVYMCFVCLVFGYLRHVMRMATRFCLFVFGVRLCLSWPQHCALQVLLSCGGSLLSTFCMHACFPAVLFALACLPACLHHSTCLALHFVH